MHRRTFLSSVTATVGTIATSPIPVRSKSDTESGSGSEPEWCATEPQTESESAQPLASGDPAFSVSGTKPVDVFWRDQEFFDKRGYFFARALGSVGGNTIVLNRDERTDVDDYSLLHELAHTLGYRHGDGGIVNSDVALFAGRGDRDGTKLADPTRDVADSFDAYDIYESWDIETLGKLGVAFAGDDLLVTELGTAGERFAANSDVEDIHIRHSHAGFGGEFDA